MEEDYIGFEEFNRLIDNYEEKSTMIHFKISNNGAELINEDGRLLKIYQRRDYKSINSMRNKVIEDWSKMVDNLMNLD